MEGSAQAGKARELQSPARRWPDMADPLLRNSSSGPNSWSSVGCAQSPATLPSVRSHAGCCAARDRGATEDAPFSWQEYSGWMRAGLGWCPERFVQRRSRAFSRLLRAETAAQQRSACRRATGQPPMGGAGAVRTARVQPGSKTRTGNGVVRQGRGESACGGSGRRIGGPSSGGGADAVRRAVPIMTRRRPCCRFAVGVKGAGGCWAARERDTQGFAAARPRLVCRRRRCSKAGGRRGEWRVECADGRGEVRGGRASRRGADAHGRASSGVVGGGGWWEEGVWEMDVLQAPGRWCRCRELRACRERMCGRVRAAAAAGLVPARLSVAALVAALALAGQQLLQRAHAPPSAAPPSPAAPRKRPEERAVRALNLRLARHARPTRQAQQPRATAISRHLAPSRQRESHRARYHVRYSILCHREERPCQPADTRLRRRPAALAWPTILFIYSIHQSVRSSNPSIHPWRAPPASVLPRYTSIIGMPSPPRSTRSTQSRPRAAFTTCLPRSAPSLSDTRPACACAASRAPAGVGRNCSCQALLARRQGTRNRAV